MHMLLNVPLEYWENMIEIILAVFLIAFASFVVVRIRKTRTYSKYDRHIPGPGTFSAMKKILSVGVEGFHLSIDKLGKENGDIFAFLLVEQHFVFLNNERFVSRTT